MVLTAFSDSPMAERARNLNVNDILAKGKSSSADIQEALENAIVRAGLGLAGGFALAFKGIVENQAVKHPAGRNGCQRRGQHDFKRCEPEPSDSIPRFC